MLTDENKILVCRTLDNCWFFNLTKQNMCQDIFQTYNRVWNSLFAEEIQTEEISSDNTKFRKLLETILEGDKFTNFILSSSLTGLSEISPLIHNDSLFSQRYGRPFSLSEANRITGEESEDATEAHREFNNYLFKVREKTNSKNKKKFISKLSRLLYVVRSNIAHGSKLQYQGSKRNEQICEVIYRVLLDLSNLILNNGLFKIAAYGELKRDGGLHSPLVIDNDGNFLVSAEVVGGVLNIDNSLVFNSHSEFERTDVDILEFKYSENLYTIDLVECMPRSLTPFYMEGTLGGFAWIYQRFMQIEDYNGPINPIDRETAMRDRCITFLYTLISLKQVYSKRLKVSEKHRKKFFGKLTLEIGNVIHYDSNKTGQNLVHPLAPNMICLIDEIGKSFNLIFNRTDRNYPFSHMIEGAIFEDVGFNKQFYHKFDTNAEDDTAQKMYAHLVKEIVHFIALWVCEQCGDPDGLIWKELNPGDNQVH